MENKSVEELMPRLSLIVTIMATVIGFVLGVIVDAGLESFNQVLIVSVMVVVSVADLFFARIVGLPAMARDANIPRSNLFVIGYSQATFPAAVALVVPIFAGEWVALFFGGLGIVFWLVVRDYLGQLPVNTSQAQS